jgi:hypothetical protein
MQMLGADGTVTDRRKQRELLNVKYRWVLEMVRPEGVMESPDTLANNLRSVEMSNLTWRLEIHTTYRAREGWVPWLRFRSSNTNTGYRVYALREFRRGELIGWFYGVKVSENPSEFVKHDVDAEGTTNVFAGMGLHLLANPMAGIEDPMVAQRVKSLVNVDYKSDGAVLAKKAIPVNEELRGFLGNED